MFQLFRSNRSDQEDVPAACESLLRAIYAAGGTLSEAAALQLGGPEAINEACNRGLADVGGDRSTVLILTKRGKRAALRLKQRGPR